MAVTVSAYQVGYTLDISWSWSSDHPVSGWAVFVNNTRVAGGVTSTTGESGTASVPAYRTYPVEFQIGSTEYFKSVVVEAPPQPTGPYIWNGSEWKEATPYIWTGSAWVPATANIWDGSAWQS